MPLQKLPVVDLDNVNHRRRARETINNVLSHQHDDSRVQTSGEKISGVTPINYAYPPGNILRYGADPTGVESATRAFNQAILAAANDFHRTVTLEPGMYRFATAPDPIGYGIKIRGHGSQGSTEPYGCVLKVDYSSADFLVWDGNGANFRGTGGGLEDVLIIAENGRSPNRAIYIYATSDDRRPGEMMFKDVLIYGTGTGSWSSVLEVDGRNANTAGGRGVRTLVFNKFRVATARDNNKYVWFRQVTHVSGDIQMDTVSGTGTLGMTIDDIWDHVNLNLRAGNVIVNYTGSDNPSLSLRGECNALDINTTAAIGSCPIKVIGGLTNQSSLVRFSNYQTDELNASLSSTVTNVTGNGTLYTVIFDAESYDHNTAYDNSTGIYTIKVAGIADIDAQLLLSNLGAAHTTGEMFIDHRDSGGSSRNSVSTKFGVGPMRDAANQCSISCSTKLKVFEGDTIKIQINVSGSTQTVHVVGATTRYSFFSVKVLA